MGKKRFEVVFSEGNVLTSVGKSILLDTETGVQYLMIKDGYGCGITPLLDADGKVVTSTIRKDYN